MLVEEGLDVDGAARWHGFASFSRCEAPISHRNRSCQTSDRTRPMAVGLRRTTFACERVVAAALTPSTRSSARCRRAAAGCSLHGGEDSAPRCRAPAARARDGPTSTPRRGRRRKRRVLPRTRCGRAARSAARRRRRSAPPANAPRAARRARRHALAAPEARARPETGARAPRRARPTGRRICRPEPGREQDGGAPLPPSSSRVAAARPRLPVRSTLVAPILPEPTARMSPSPAALVSSSPNGMEPSR